MKSLTPALSLAALLVAALPLTAQAQTSPPSDAPAAPSAAHDEEAHLLFMAGERAYQDGRIDDALASFERALLLSNREALHYNVALCHDRLDHTEEAIEHFRAFLQAQPEADNRPTVEARIRVLEARRERGTSADSTPPLREPTTEAASEPNPEPNLPPASAVDAAVPAVVFSLAGVSLGVGIGLLVQASTHRARLEELCPSHVCAAEVTPELEALDQWTLMTDVAMGISAGTAVLGTVLLVWHLSSFTSASPTPAIDVAVGVGGVQVRGAF